MLAAMARAELVLEVTDDPALARDLMAGGVFIAGRELAMYEDCDLVVRRAGVELRVAARAVWIKPGSGTGLQLTCSAEAKQQLSALVRGEPTPVDGGAATAPVDEPSADDADDTPPEDDDPPATDEERKLALNVQERLRGLTMAQQIKIAKSGEAQERIVLERMYGKTVWEALLRNPRLTGPEVARIARMGSLPRPLIEVIVSNGAWLQIPEVRRSLLSNPRLAPDQIVRVVRLLPKHELKLAAIQTTYPMAVREVVRRLLKE